MDKPTCYRCKDRVSGNAFLIGKKTLFHIHCYRCKCGQDLTIAPSDPIDHGQCMKCWKNQSPLLCKVCQNAIKSSIFKRVEQNLYHKGCLVCEKCRLVLGDGADKKCFPINGKYFCLNCHYDVRSGKYLRGTFVVANEVVVE